MMKISPKLRVNKPPSSIMGTRNNMVRSLIKTPALYPRSNINVMSDEFL
jgi:hypothetical protein